MDNNKSLRIFITGGSKGIGKALTLEYAKRGSSVFLFARNETALEELTKYINEYGGKASYFAGDVTIKDNVDNAVSKAVEEMGGIDLAFLNAGVSGTVYFSELGSANVVEMFNVNLIGNLYCMKSIIPIMKRQHSGKIVGISSIASFRAVPGSSSYAASKVAFDYLLESARYELKELGIDVITVRFGFVRTDIIKKNDFYMPFLMEAEECAHRIADGVAAGKKKIQFPIIMVMLTKIFKILPEVVYKQLVKFRIK